MRAAAARRRSSQANCTALPAAGRSLSVAYLGLRHGLRVGARITLPSRIYCQNLRCTLPLSLSPHGRHEGQASPLINPPFLIAANPGLSSLIHPAPPFRLTVTKNRDVDAVLTRSRYTGGRRQCRCRPRFRHLLYCCSRLRAALHTATRNRLERFPQASCTRARQVVGRAHPRERSHHTWPWCSSCSGESRVIHKSGGWGTPSVQSRNSDLGWKRHMLCDQSMLAAAG